MILLWIGLLRKLLCSGAVGSVLLAAATFSSELGGLDPWQMSMAVVFTAFHRQRHSISPNLRLC